MGDLAASKLFARQAVLDRDRPPKFWVLMDESALHREIAPAKVMAEQLGHLVSVARRTNVTVQLISARGGTRRLVGRVRGSRDTRNDCGVRQPRCGLDDDGFAGNRGAGVQ